MNRTVRKSTTLYAGAVFLAAAAFVFPIWLYGIPQSHDTVHHFQAANALYESISGDGNPFPVWAANENDGYGGVVLRLYPPLAYLVLAIARTIAGNWYDAGWLAFLFWSAIGGWGVFLWAREWFSEKSALAAAVMFVFAPYHAIQLYGAFIYAEFAAASVLPFCFLFVARLCRRPSVANIAGLGAFYALLVLTHLPLALIGSICIFLYFIFCPKTESFAPSALKFSAGIAVGSAASCFQWLRVLREMDWVGISTEKFSAHGFYDYRENFLLSFPYLKNGLDLDADVHHLWFMDLSLAVTFCFVLPLAILFYRKASAELKINLRAPLFLCAFAFFMLTPLSYPLWQHAALLQKVQFPWRWFAVFSICAVIFVAAGFEYLASMAKPKTRPIFLLLVGSLLIGLSFTFSQIIRQAVYLPETEFARLAENLPARASIQEWLPIWANKQTAKVKEKISSERAAEITNWNATEKNFTVAAGGASDVRVAAFYYPQWSATLNDANLSVEPAPDGAILLRLPASETEATVNLKFTESAAVLISFYVTAALWLAIIIFCLWNTLSKSKI